MGCRFQGAQYTKDHSRADQSGIQGIGLSRVYRQTMSIDHTALISKRLLYFWANIEPWNLHIQKNGF